MSCCISYCSNQLSSGKKQIDDAHLRNELRLTLETSHVCLDCYDTFVLKRVNHGEHVDKLKKRVQEERDRSTLFLRKLTDDLQSKFSNFLVTI